MAQGFSLKDQLFNAQSLGQLGAEYAAGLPGLDGQAFARQALSGVPERSLMACLDWFADCITPHLSPEFVVMADQIEAMMPPPLDPALRDDDFGRFIHAVPGILAVRHGLEHHRDRALDLIHAATQRFSMEFSLRAFLNRWPDATLARLALWAEDDNYHVRRLVSEGTRPKLPWGRAIALTPEQTLPLLDRLHGDPTRFVTRSVANHLNDISKTDTDAVLAHLRHWQDSAVQDPQELAWMARHALRTRIKAGHAGAMAHLGYAADAHVDVTLQLEGDTVAIGDRLRFDVALQADEALPVLVDYRIRFAGPGPDTKTAREKVFKLKTAKLAAATPLVMSKAHPMNGGASTFSLHKGTHELVVQVNGTDRARATFELV
ncbi:DNA alkylation repair protein [Pseudosulfitobacter koreensis]|uniref:DNA alkylation repair protein n=1 Tax=Pseudosulfitobacter koreensis TaxID=2968472 RepID=A0ABT1Z022_9RHOB|nr:DNA alkylation repair protein [Pseudosulfitobacter koreense]MCR8826487.1 DNA alkylation repair protein [Pseudosulfitobacter koreense]